MPSLTLAQIVSRGQAFLQDDDVYWSESTELEVWANEAQEYFVQRTGCIKVRTTLAVDGTQSPATAFYTVPAGTIDVLSAYDSQNLTELKLVTTGWLEDQDPDWESRAGNPIVMIFGEQEYGLTLARVQPYPAAALTGIKVWRTRLPATMTTGGGSPQGPEIGPEDQMAIVYGMLERAWSKEHDFQDLGKAAEYRARFEERVSDHLLRKARKASMKLPIRRRRDF